jgi:UDP-N-acetylglucosamine acyltransferase
VSRNRVHPTAVVDPAAQLDDGVVVDAYAIVGGRVRIGRSTHVGAHAVVGGNTTIGTDNRIFHHASVGAEPQDLKYHGEDSELIIGNRNTIREFATLHTGTEGGGMITRIGDDNLLMNYSHVPHDCSIGSHVIVANAAQIGGHVIIEDYAIIGALVGIHQFSRIGESAILGAGSMVSQDVPPFCNATGDRAQLYGLNLLGLKRRGFGPDAVNALKRAYRIVFQSQLKLAEAVERARAELSGAEVERFLAFITASERGVCRPERSAPEA